MLNDIPAAVVHHIGIHAARALIGAKAHLIYAVSLAFLQINFT